MIQFHKSLRIFRRFKKKPEQGIICSKTRRLEFLQNGQLSDCEVHVKTMKGCNNRIRVCYAKFLCHKIFLATASEEFERLINASDTDCPIVQINNVLPEVVKLQLQYIYTYEVKKDEVMLEYFEDIQRLSSIYSMPGFKKAYVDAIASSHWPIEKILPTYQLAFNYNENDLEEVAIKKALEHGVDILKHKTFFDLEVYPLHCLMQHFIWRSFVPKIKLMQNLKEYQRHNKAGFNNLDKFEHFMKIIGLFSDTLLDEQGYILTKVKRRSS